MNKKFSTLVASLLLTSAFSVYSVDAKPMLATPTQVETRATAADVEDAVEVNSLPDLYTHCSSLRAYILSGFTNNARLFYAGTQAATMRSETAYVSVGSDEVAIGGYNKSDSYYWTLKNHQLVNNAGETFSVNGVNKFEIIPVKTSNPDDPTYYFVLAARNNQGQLLYVTKDNTPVNDGTFVLLPANSDINDAAFFVSVETAYTDAIKADKLNDVMGNGFKVSISSLVDEDAVIAGADVFEASKLTAKAYIGGEFVDATNAYTDAFWMREDGKIIVFDENGDITTDPQAQKGVFKAVNAADALNYTNYNSFRVYEADNKSGEIKVVRGGTSSHRFYIANTNGAYALSFSYAGTGAENWAKVTIGDNNTVDLREFLTGQFYTVDFVKSMDNPADANDEYKKGGRLAIRENGTTDYADYVDASSLYSKAPEAQWAISSTENADGPYFDGTITLTNRENPSVIVTIDALRRAEDGSGFVVVIGSSQGAPVNTGLSVNDVVRITAVANHTKNDGYEVFSDNDLKNETYHLGQLRQTADGDINVYWAENHNASHQIGATVDSLKATRWNLSLVKKANAGNDYVGQTDSVLVVSELQEWNSVKNRIDVKQDTLVILPYAFQNRSNSEFAEFNDGKNLDYYQCNVYNQGEKKVYKYGEDAMFALKRKADVDGQPVYNYVMLKAKEASDYTKGAVNAISTAAYAAEKVYQENSTDRGTWKNMQMYAGDANALMFVNKVYAPEYRKLVADAALDTITIYRGDNEHQVVYEKKNKDAVVNGDTLSFLNVDNDVQFTNINPALYADSAYVNRGDNTRWQYLLAVNVEHVEGYYCPDHGFRPEDTCEHSKWVSYNKGRYLINMIDTANIYGKTAGIHNNPYINETEEGNQCAKLSFVDAIHVLADGVDPEMADKLYVINGTEKGDTSVIDLGSDALNVAKFAFKYTDSMESDEFKIQTQWKDYNPTAYGTNAYAAPTENGYLRWVNGCIVVDNGYEKGDVFNMNEDETRTPTANEEISAEEATVSVVATDGAVIVKGAEGKNVIVSTILGKVVANEVVNSDNETIAAPAGIVVVSVDGESFKVAVK